MKALISPEENAYAWDGQILGARVAEVSIADFPVAPPLFWLDCADDVTADGYYFDREAGVILPKPLSPEEELAVIVDL